MPNIIESYIIWKWIIKVQGFSSILSNKLKQSIS